VTKRCRPQPVGSAITDSSAWKSGNNAIVVTWDEGASNQGCCDAIAGGGQPLFIVVTNNGPRRLSDATIGNHCSTLERSAGVRT
jgi:hypothetical protein